MEQLTNQELIQSLIEAGYNAQIEEIPGIEGAVEILNDSEDEFGPIEQRNIIINWINDNMNNKRRRVGIGGSKKRQSKKRRYKTNKKRRYKKKRRQTVKR